MLIVFVVFIIHFSTIRFTGTAGIMTLTIIHHGIIHHGLCHGDGEVIIRHIPAGVGDIHITPVIGIALMHIIIVDGDIHITTATEVTTVATITTIMVMDIMQEPEAITGNEDLPVQT